MSNNVLLLAGRILISAIFVFAGWGTLRGIAGSAAYFTSLGLPFGLPVAWAVGLFEFFGGVAVLVGFQTRTAAWLFALFCIFAGLIGHYGQGDSPAMAFMHSQALMKDLGLAGGFLLLAVYGPGSLSVDARRRRAART